MINAIMHSLIYIFLFQEWTGSAKKCNIKHNVGVVIKTDLHFDQCYIDNNTPENGVWSKNPADIKFVSNSILLNV